MKENRIYNFNAGPAALPLEVLEEIKDSFLNFGGSGMSITEISHRSTLFDDVINDAVARTRRLLKLDDKFHVLFIQGGASLQFSMIPMNLLGDGDSADFGIAGGGRQEAGDHAHGGGLAGAVGSEETEDFAFFYREREIVHSEFGSELFGEVFDFDHGGVVFESWWV